MNKLYEFVGMLVLNGYSESQGELMRTEDIVEYRNIVFRKRIYPMDIIITIDCMNMTYGIRKENAETQVVYSEEEYTR